MTLLRSLRGSIVNAQIAYPTVLHVEILDLDGGVWRLATQDAEWSPSDPNQLIGRTIDHAEIDDASGQLRCVLSDGSTLDVSPAAGEGPSDPPYWELISPAGLVLEFGPGVRWQISGAEAPITSAR
jgi:hypothetical protein